MQSISAPVAIYPPPPTQTSVLLVTAHPDDEYYCAATVYRLAREMGGTVDQLIITDGAGGHRFAALAGHFYGLDLAEGGKDHHKLPSIRREESLRAGKLLGVRATEFLGQPDPGYTRCEKVACKSWQVKTVRDRIADRLQTHSYDFVFVLAPRPEEHGHHQAVATLVREAIALQPVDQRPVLIAVEPGHSSQHPIAMSGNALPAYQFSRSRAVSKAECLTYSVIVNWLIAEHKSQGLFQLESGRHDVERLWLLDPEQEARSRAQRLFSLLEAA
ncbi:PIG-L family deacetylase [Bryobacter aggregatus]|uniref:PIG-L family deacetylase n=1 Tax=Bryobacter aggregatus TaxID=360054 RepID=UPI00138E2ED1|nr:PIG-L family deacetylase [Bryobacter aggregatus]